MDKDSIINLYQDLTGRFPVQSLRGSEYVLVGYHYDANCILGYPVRDRQAPTLTDAWQHLQDDFVQAGIAPESWVLHNEVFRDLKAAFKKNDVAFQVVSCMNKT